MYVQSFNTIEAKLKWSSRYKITKILFTDGHTDGHTKDTRTHGRTDRLIPVYPQKIVLRVQTRTFDVCA